MGEGEERRVVTEEEMESRRRVAKAAQKLGTVITADEQLTALEWLAALQTWQQRMVAVALRDEIDFTPESGSAG